MRKLRLIATLFVVALLSTQMFAQTLGGLTDQLPVDENVKIGTLENGMKYYIRKNNQPENRAELTLVVNAGSVLEDEDQRGLAHMVEHMAFNGTKNFEKHEIINFLESIGMKFGPEVNAYTSFDETVYGIKVPLDKEEYLDKGLLVLFDWASGVSLEGVEIDAERGVIHEEWRMSQGADERMRSEYLPAMLYDSKYANRLPIGTMDVVMNCKHETLRRFYNDWYRPDLMAVVVVGDFDVKEMEKKVIKQFSQIKKVENPRERTVFEVPNHNDTKVVIAKDKEASQTVIQLIYKHEQKATKTHADYRESIAHQLYNQMIASRLQELTVKADPPFLYGGASYGGFLGGRDAYTGVAVAQSEKIREALETLVIENERVKKFGFAKTELERVKKSLLRSIEKVYKESPKTKSASYVDEYKGNFLTPHDPIPGIAYEYEMYKAYIPTITVEEINTFAAKWITRENRVVVVMTPEKEGVVLPTEDELLSIIDDVNTDVLTAYVDKSSDLPLLSKLPVAGKVIKTEKNKKLDFQTYTLSNGAKVVIKKTDFKADEILFRAYSEGGWSLTDTKDDINASVATDVVGQGGLGNYDQIELDKFLSDKVARLYPYINETTEGLSGSTTPDDLETFLQLVYGQFQRPNRDQEAFTSYMDKMNASLENKAASPENAFREAIQILMSQNHPRQQPMTVDRLSEINYKRALRIYEERFADPNNFTYYFVGNIDAKTALPLIEKYIGGLPTVNREESFKNLGIEKPRGKVEKIIYKGDEPKSIVYLDYHNKFDYSFEEKMELDLICKILTTKLLESIREEESGVYSIGAYPRMAHFPVSEFDVIINFGCSPDNVDKLIAGVEEQIKILINEGPTAAELDKAIQKKLREREGNSRENRYWIGQLYSYDYHKANPKDYFKYEKYLKKVSAKNIKKAAKKFLAHGNVAKVVLKPAKK